jgi:ABC-type branched-subunit amino acid transport system ATPase component
VAVPDTFPIPAPLVGFLAVLGGVAIVFRLLRALFRLGLATAEKTALEGMAEVSARRGDLTAMAEQRQQVRAVASTRRLDIASALVLGALLVVPPMAGVAQLAYAAGSLLWLLPRRPLRARILPTPPPPEEEE